MTDFGSLEEAAGNAAFVMALRGRGLRDTAVLRAMELVSRETFAPQQLREHARRDIALPLPCGASMTAPVTVALMLALLRVEPGQRVLEIGTGSGYATALLARLGAGAVLSLERYGTLAADAAARLAPLSEVHVVQADGLAPELPDGGFDRILVHGRVPDIPHHWRAALEPGGRLVTGLDGDGCCRVAVLATPEADPEPGAPVRLAALVPGLGRVL
ncbi:MULTISPECIES: protein-L-isoaspartate O-methyltransferase family protein [Methylobacterium]|uniref:Protein-L-isoaspartate O-methyltransferase n=1 Tax=Methylobacterium longum TaxID=767694 RepID=A0ABT8AKG3_9HYPH|nr:MULTISPECIES: methyltransferase domain-containing protein [Methylobacterium]MCJ2098526.1 methyltransferase domain-containing protein [Methylobacterium sp. E-046]MDN3570332.1 methyltransferase domain-containing protein [Methylobacterium longum]GJE11329.1 Protein-L-isoaspartate O-methyltransferase [Methylobacterium longum]